MKKTRITAVLDIIHGDNIRVDKELNGLVMPDGKTIRFYLEPEVTDEQAPNGPAYYTAFWTDLEDPEEDYIHFDGYAVHRVEQLCDVPDDYFDHPRALGDSR